jgi:carnitine O-acetyltransferase
LTRHADAGISAADLMPPNDGPARHVEPLDNVSRHPPVPHPAGGRQLHRQPASRNDQPSVHWTIPGRTTFAFQSSLPPLPLPPLDATIARYLESCTPLLSAAELAHTTALAKAFVRGEGGRLQAALAARAAGCCAERGYPHVHWLEEWWDRFAYLSDRTPLPVRYNIFGTLFGGQGTPDSGSRLRRAAQLLRSAGLFYLQLRSEAISPDSLDTRGTIPLCMFQYKRLFGSSRVPGEKEDRIVTVAEPVGHVAVFCLGRVYSLRIIDGVESAAAPADAPTPPAAAPAPSGVTEMESPASGVGEDCSSPCLGDGSGAVPPIQKMMRVASVSEIAAGLAAIEIAAATAGEATHPVCLLSSLPRDEWARHRTAIARESSFNASSLREIETSLLALSLCSDAPADMPALCKATHEGGCGCVWYDKPLTLLVFANGKAGAHMEHAHFDAPITSRAFAFMARAIDDEQDQTLPADLFSEDQIPPADCPSACSGAGQARFRPAPFDLSGLPSVRQAMAPARARFGALSRNNNLVPVRFDGVGATALRAAKLPPDAIVQMALQLAQWRDQGCRVATYETASTRRFLHGRTETARACSAEAAAFVRAMDRLAAAGDAGAAGRSSVVEQSTAGQATAGQITAEEASGQASAKQATTKQARGEQTAAGQARAGNVTDEGTAERATVEQATASARHALAAALKAHVGLLLAASSALGVDRHMMGLRIAAAAAGLPTPALFADVGYTRSSSFGLSTSNMSKPGLAKQTDDFAGFGAPTAASYGVCYDVRDNCITMLVSSDRSCRSRDAGRFGRAIQQALADVCALALGGQAEPHSRL